MGYRFSLGSLLALVSTSRHEALITNNHEARCFCGSKCTLFLERLVKTSIIYE